MPRVIGRLIEPVYRRAIARRNRAFDAGRGVVRLDRPVFSVGNLSVGGTGKTPMVQWVVSVLRDAGHSPCVAMRGYRGRSGLSDEARLHERALGVPVVAQADRVAGLRALFASARGEEVDCVVLDDGFQHRRIARDLDIVLIDATRSPFDDALLPAGWQREPVESLRRAKAVVLTHAECADEAALARLEAQVRGVMGEGGVVARAQHAWRGLRVFERGHERSEGVAWLDGRRVRAVCAIANPGAFISQVERHAEIVDRVVLRDHDPYRARTVQRVCAGGEAVDAIVMTEKDWVKVEGRGISWPCAVVRPELEPAFVGGEDVLRRLVVDAVEGGVGG